MRLLLPICRGSMQVCSMLIPCIEPTNTDAAITVSAGPVFVAAGINNAASKRCGKYIRQHFWTSLFRNTDTPFPICNKTRKSPYYPRQNGNTLPSENVSDIYEGIQVVTPSRSEPWIIMAAIINTKAAAVQFTAFPLFSLSLLFTFSLVFKPPHKTSHIAAVIKSRKCRK